MFKEIFAKVLTDVLKNKMQPLKTEYNPVTDNPTYLNGSENNSQDYNSYNEPIQQNQGVMNKLANGFSDFSRGYQENRNNAFAPNNLTANQFVETNNNTGDVTTYNKGAMARLGEFVGSASRAANNPGVQAAIAGTLGTALTGNPLYGAGLAYKYGSNKNKSNIYQQALQDQGINVDNGALTNIGATDFNALYKPVSDAANRKIDEDRLNQQILYQQALIDKYNNDLEERIRHNKSMEGVNQTKANASVTRANTAATKVANKGKSNGGMSKNTDLKAVEELQNRGYRLVNGKWVKQ